MWWKYKQLRDRSSLTEIGESIARSIDEPPVPVFALAQVLGISVEYAAVPEAKAYSNFSARRAEISLPLELEEDPESARYLVAHAIGRILLESVGEKILDRNPRDQLADAVLVPRPFLEKFGRPAKWDATRLAVVFAAPVEVVLRRIRLYAQTA